MSGQYHGGYVNGGLTLRDYFAAAALQGMCGTDSYTIKKTAEMAYEQADAMLKERE